MVHSLIMQTQIEIIEGVPVRFIYKKDAPIYIRVEFKAGSRYDIKEGTAHFLEHMLVAGTEKFPSKDLISEYIENVGGQFSLSTDGDSIRIDVQIGTPEDIHVAITVLDEMINKTLFNENAFRNEKGAILSEQLNKKSNQKEFVNEVGRRLFYQGTNMARTNLGTKESLDSITLEDLVDFKKQHLTLDNLSVYIAGDVNIQVLKNEIINFFPKIRGIKNDTTIDLPIIRDDFTDTEIYSSSKQSSLLIGFRTHPFDLKSKVCGDICAHYLGGGRSSELTKELRYKRGLVYSISSYYAHNTDKALLRIRTDCAVEHTKETLEVIKEVLKNIHDKGITKEKVAFIKIKMMKSFKIILQTSQAMINHSMLFSIEDYLKTLEMITEEDIQNFISNNIIINKMYIASCGPEDIKKILAIK